MSVERIVQINLHIETLKYYLKDYLSTHLLKDIETQATVDVVDRKIKSLETELENIYKMKAEIYISRMLQEK